MTTTTEIHDVNEVEVSKTTQDTFNGVEKVNIKTEDHIITIFGSRDEESHKEKTIELEVAE